MLQVAVCEDNPIQSDVILALLNRYHNERPGIDIQLHSFDNATELLQNIEDGQTYNLFLLDILLPEMNGIELAQELRIKNVDVPIIFLTSSTDHALDAFKVSAFQYMLKPIKADTLFPVLDNIIPMLAQKKERFCTVTMRKRTVRLPFSSIVCVELSGRALKYYLDNGDVILSNTIRTSFSEAIKPLLEDRRFLFEHKSFVLNMEHVKEIGNNIFEMKNNIEVPIPKYNYAKAKSTYLTWLNGKPNDIDL